MINLSLLQSASAYLVSFGLFMLVIAFYLLGHRFRRRAIRKKPEFASFDFGAISGALLAILGLLLAFTFSMSNSRFDVRRQLIIEEANDIGTVTLRTDI